MLAHLSCKQLPEPTESEYLFSVRVVCVEEGGGGGGGGGREVTEGRRKRTVH